MTMRKNICYHYEEKKILVLTSVLNVSVFDDLKTEICALCNKRVKERCMAYCR